MVEEKNVPLETPVACMFHVPVNDDTKTYFKEIIVKYARRYVLGWETSPYPHAHVFGYFKENGYYNFSKIISKKFGLCGRPGNGKARQYGKVKFIKDKNKMIAYTLKSGDYSFKGFSPAEINLYKSMSFPKEETEKDKKLQLFNYLNSAIPPPDNIVLDTWEPDIIVYKSPEYVAQAILRWYRDTKRNLIGANRVKQLTFEYLYTFSEEKITTEMLYKLYFPMGI